MALTPIPKVDNAAESVPMESERYPYGTKIRLCDEVLEALKVDLSAGDEVTVKAAAFVERKEEEAEEGEDKEIEVCLQITAMEVSRAGPDRAAQLYGGGSDDD